MMRVTFDARNHLPLVIVDRATHSPFRCPEGKPSTPLAVLYNFAWLSAHSFPSAGMEDKSPPPSLLSTRLWLRTTINYARINHSLPQAAIERSDARFHDIFAETYRA